MSSCRWSHGSRQIDPHRINTTYQPTGAQSNQECLCTFPILIKGKHIKVMTDNIACVVFINWQEGAKSPSLWAEAVKLGNGCIWHSMIISASYLSSVQNTTADSLSRTFSEEHKWKNGPWTAPQHILRLGSPKNRLVFHIQKQEMLPALLQSWAGTAFIGRCLPLSVEHWLPLCLPSISTHIECPAQNKKRQSKSYSHSSDMAKTNVVSIPYASSNVPANHSSATSSPLVSKHWTDLLPKFSSLSTQGMAPRWFQSIERWILFSGGESGAIT